MQEQVAGRVLGVAHQHQRDLGQPVVAIFKVSPELEQRERAMSSRQAGLHYMHMQIKWGENNDIDAYILQYLAGISTCFIVLFSELVNTGQT